MKKGFTLIELLAVIVILAIIALIATPIVLNIINETKDSAGLRSAEMYLDAVEQGIMRAQLKGVSIGGTYNILEDGTLCNKVLKENETCPDENKLVVEVEGEKPNSGRINILNGNIKDVTLNLNDKTIVKNSKGELKYSKSFSEDGWDVIAANVRAGNLSKYNVGDTKQITLTSSDIDIAGTYTVRIANTSTPDECNTLGFSQTACGFVIEFEDIITTHTINRTDTNIGGWEASLMRSYVNNDIYNAFPEELKENIINTYVVSGHENGKTENYKTTDKVYLLSTKEVWGKEGASNQIDYDTADETRQLDYYKNLGVTSESYEGAMKGEEDWWWLRSASSIKSPFNFNCVSNNGGWLIDYADDENGVSVAFRIG